MRKSTLYLWFTAAGFFLLAALLGLHPAASHSAAKQRMALERQIVARLALTDICLFTEAAYTRHPNLADRFTPFQDHPLAFSHFPSESLMAPPAHLRHPRKAVLKELEP